MKRSILVMLACGMTMPGVWAGTVPTAMKAAELADNEVKTGGQFRVVRLEGEDTDSDLRPRQWDITVYDTIRGNHATTVRVKDGVVVSTAGAVRMLDDTRWSQFGRNFTGYDPSEIILINRWKLDSSDALNKVTALPGMDKVQLTDAKMVLRKLSDGDVTAVWRIKVKARSKAQPGREGWIGSVDLSAETGEVLQTTLRPERLTN